MIQTRTRKSSNEFYAIKVKKGVLLCASFPKRIGFVFLPSLAVHTIYSRGYIQLRINARFCVFLRIARGLGDALRECLSEYHCTPPPSPQPPSICRVMPSANVHLHHHHCYSALTSLIFENRNNTNNNVINVFKHLSLN